MPRYAGTRQQYKPKAKKSRGPKRKASNSLAKRLGVKPGTKTRWRLRSKLDRKNLAWRHRQTIPATQGVKITARGNEPAEVMWTRFKKSGNKGKDMAMGETREGRKK